MQHASLWTDWIFIVRLVHCAPSNWRKHVRMAVALGALAPASAVGKPEGRALEEGQRRRCWTALLRFDPAPRRCRASPPQVPEETR